AAERAAGRRSSHLLELHHHPQHHLPRPVRLDGLALPQDRRPSNVADDEPTNGGPRRRRPRLSSQNGVRITEPYSGGGFRMSAFSTSATLLTTRYWSAFNLIADICRALCPAFYKYTPLVLVGVAETQNVLLMAPRRRHHLGVDVVALGRGKCTVAED